jgi:hypothetical protein
MGISLQITGVSTHSSGKQRMTVSVFGNKIIFFIALLIILQHLKNDLNDKKLLFFEIFLLSWSDFLHLSFFSLLS